MGHHPASHWHARMPERVVSRRAMPPHLFRPDPDVPPDQNGRRACLCGLVGEPGDAHHTLPATAGRDAAELAAGEREDG